MRKNDLKKKNKLRFIIPLTVQLIDNGFINQLNEKSSVDIGALQIIGSHASMRKYCTKLADISYAVRKVSCEIKFCLFLLRMLHRYVISSFAMKFSLNCFTAHVIQMQVRYFRALRLETSVIL